MREGRMMAARVKLAVMIGVTATILILIVLCFALNSRIELRTIERDNALALARSERNALDLTIKNYRAAAKAASDMAHENVMRARTEQAAISEGKIRDLKTAYALVDARLVRARAQIAANPHLRSTEAAPMSLASDATCRAYGGGSCDELLAKLTIAERQAWNLVALRDWVRRQALVQFEPEGDGK